jgi:hypothetical protein
LFLNDYLILKTPFQKGVFPNILKVLYFPSKNSVVGKKKKKKRNTTFENFNNSENNIISAELAMVLHQTWGVKHGFEDAPDISSTASAFK